MIEDKDYIIKNKNDEIYLKDQKIERLTRNISETLEEENSTVLVFENSKFDFEINEVVKEMREKHGEFVYNKTTFQNTVYDPKVTLGDGQIYDGEWLKEPFVMQGNGRMLYSDGSIYEG